MKYEDIVYEKEGRIAILTLNRPEVMNAYTRKMVREMADAIDDAANDDQIRGLIVTANGRGFCTGVNNKDTEGERTGVRSIVRHELRLYPAMQRLWEFDKPTICAINGTTAGAGTALAMVCDVRIASDQAKFILVWARRGMVPDNGASYFLVRHLSPSKAYELTYSGDAVDAQEMLRVGLVSKVVPHDDLVSEAKTLAMHLTKGSPIATQLSKQLIRRATMEQDLYMQMELEGNFQRIATKTDDFKEMAKAAREKREPDFKGK
ncbi:MAG: enoyl-CoA hydratase/isomerase family protein [Chloroflexi bacterium]|jgi:2-(1,2-epoxy-1,2-dihydrophenyl)acetyl-CoA isomerase|nr:enoyl-CoA hydratase/isomerase family protein [Chloroflexota bacterium]MBT7082326.1 enoyl-CoA hydratase/isomerase family protein [Chloroflexota bacterium]MBT7290605.1 enoyl-CoA hydratase/isomerase family protein [Chloroflexota bacterium]